jgi:hypothetical protein
MSLNVFDEITHLSESQFLLFFSLPILNQLNKVAVLAEK